MTATAQQKFDDNFNAMEIIRSSLTKFDGAGVYFVRTIALAHLMHMHGALK